MDSRLLSHHPTTLIIAEAGVNHNGDIGLAKDLVHIAADAGADIVKFQSFYASNLTTPQARKPPYQRGLENESQLSMLKRLELSWEAHQELIKLCDLRNIEFLSTAFCITSLNRLLQFGLKRLKIPSGEIENLPLLRAAAKTGLPIILSTGMSNMDEIRDAVNVLKNNCEDLDLSILHCNSAYPTPLHDANLLVMEQLRVELEFPVGYSDHTQGINVALAAVALGACIIEKHFTIDQTLTGPDHLASLEPEDLNRLVLGIREVELCLGKSYKDVTDSEFENRIFARRSIVAAKPIFIGETFTAENITLKRPAGGISPMMWDNVLGRCAKRKYLAEEPIEL